MNITNYSKITALSKWQRPKQASLVAYVGGLRS